MTQFACHLNVYPLTFQTDILFKLPSVHLDFPHLCMHSSFILIHYFPASFTIHESVLDILFLFGLVFFFLWTSIQCFHIHAVVLHHHTASFFTPNCNLSHFIYSFMLLSNRPLFPFVYVKSEIVKGVVDDIMFSFSTASWTLHCWMGILRLYTQTDISLHFYTAADSLNTIDIWTAVTTLKWHFCMHSALKLSAAHQLKLKCTVGISLDFTDNSSAAFIFQPCHLVFQMAVAIKYKLTFKILDTYIWKKVLISSSSFSLESASTWASTCLKYWKCLRLPFRISGILGCLHQPILDLIDFFTLKFGQNMLMKR